MTNAQARAGYVRRRLDPEQRSGLRPTLLVLAAVLVCGPFAFLLDQITDRGPVTRFDRSVAVALHEAVRSNPWTITPLRIVTTLGSTVWFVFIVTAATILLLARGRRLLAAYLVTTSIGGAALNAWIKVVVSRDRPAFVDAIAVARDKSFPSGHAFSSTAIYGALLVVFLISRPALSRRVRRFAAAGWILLFGAIAFSRMALGVHYASDVLAGISLGGAWLLASTALFRTWREPRRASDRKGRPASGPP